MVTAQILAVIIFIVMFGLIVSEKIERHIVSLGCGLLMIVLVFGVCMHSEEAAAETLSLNSFFVPNFWFQVEEAAESSSGINWATIIFIAGMMLMVEGMGRAGFFSVALPEDRKSRSLSDSTDLRNVYDYVLIIGHVH